MRPLATLVLCLAAPAALAGKASQRPLRRSAVAFNECCKGSDIDMPKFLRAAKQYCELAAQFGRFAVPSASEVRRCIEKIEQGAHKLGGKGFKTMRALLQAEVALQHAQSASLSAAHAAGHRSSSPPACSGLPFGPRKGALAAWVRGGGHERALMPDRRCRLRPPLTHQALSLHRLPLPLPLPYPYPYPYPYSYPYPHPCPYP